MHHHASHNPNEFLRSISSLCDECSEDWQASSLLGLPKGGVFTERLSRLKALFVFVSYTYVCAETHRHMDTLPRTSLHYTCINLLTDKGEGLKPLIPAPLAVFAKTIWIINQIQSFPMYGIYNFPAHAHKSLKIY